MNEHVLAQSVMQWAALTHAFSEDDLNREWAWRAHTDEGVRFAFFRVYEELRMLAANLAADRARSGPPVTAAHHALRSYQAAWRDLQAVLSGVPDDLIDRAPAEGEWPVRHVLGHMFAVPRMFFSQTSYALRERRAGRALEHPMPDAEIEPFLGHTWDQYDATIGGTLASILADYARLHDRILHELAAVTPDEVSAVTLWWEGYEVPVQFRLHRFDSHMRQHTIQIEKTLEVVSGAPPEVRRLNRIIFSALADAEGARIGAWELGSDLMQAAADRITALAGEIGAAVQSV